MKSISTKELQTLLEEGKKVNIIDVRETSEVATGKIPGAVNMPLGLLEFKMNELDKKEQYYVNCQAGGRSSSACKFLDNQGYNVTNVEGGMTAWEGEVE
ncbi:rhodanese-like domain-containing protein [Planococcus halocryophilus]|uniref:rhodanese-like domain-containing protein n=1 Tax=Planococcus halocryophilus TaxID=1215089 RepID=UPI001F0FAD44|nr:rhodanese-like domain-containing protein [Planococcus halocryophilus]MCH4827058.1 rhodanese-like domain-containing protein [Planococcus halocryophilus]